MTEARALSVVVPAYNEERRLPALLDLFDGPATTLLEEIGLRLHELIVVDDGSTDSTRDVLAARVGSISGVTVIRFETNRGKGAAVQAGMLAAEGNLALMTDVDVATPLGETAALLAALDRGFDVAIGSRALPTSTIAVRQPRHRELMGRTFNGMLRVSTGLSFHDTQCGFKLFRLERARRLFELQRIAGFAYDAELLVLARILAIPVAEVPVQWSDDMRTTVGLFRAPSSMALDLMRIAWLARRPERFKARNVSPAE